MSDDGAFHMKNSCHCDLFNECLNIALGESCYLMFFKLYNRVLKVNYCTRHEKQLFITSTGFRSFGLDPFFCMKFLASDYLSLSKL